VMEDVFSQVAHNVGSLKSATDMSGVFGERPRSELELMMEEDPHLAELYKQVQDAVAEHKELIKNFGKEDAMAEIALFKLESAQGAFETRLIELQKDPVAAAQLSAKVRLEEEEFEEEQEKKMKTQLAQEMRTREAYDRVGRQNLEKYHKKSSVWGWAAVIYFLLLPSIQKSQNSLYLGPRGS